jgi:thioredoxin-like negative regulator of GroEL
MKLLPFSLQRTGSGMRLRIAWLQAILALVALLLIGWLGVASAAYLFVKYRRDFSEVRFVHMLLYPLKKEAYRTARGDFIIEQAKVQIKEQKYREAFHNLRVGFSQSPRNRDGRMLLAQLYVGWRRTDIAQAILVEGLEFNRHDHEYLQALFDFLLQRQEDNALITITDDLLKDALTKKATETRVSLIAMARATALFFRGNYDAAEDTLKKYQLHESTQGQILALRVAWERGERTTALNRLQALTEQLPENEQIYAQYAAYLREAGRDDELRRLCVLRQLSCPDRPRPRIDLLFLYDKAGDTAALESSVEELFRDFPKNEEVLLALADVATNTGRHALALRVYDYCKANGLPEEGPALMTVEAHIVAKQYRDALEACRSMIKDNPNWGKRVHSLFSGLQAIAHSGLGDIEGAQLFLNNFLNQLGLRAESMVTVANRLITVGAKDQARQVLAQAVKTDPLNQTALVGLIKLDLELGQVDTLATSLRTLLGMRKPPRALLQDAYGKLASDRFLFAPGRSALLEELRVTITNRPTSGAS